MKKVTIIDPWGKSGLNEYVQAYVDALLTFKSEVTILTNYFSTINDKQGIILKRKFFKYSENFTYNRNLRKLIRGIEYIIIQLQNALTISSNIIHFQWFLYPSIDIWVVRFLKSRGKTVYFTAHNSKPHNYNVSKKYIEILKNVDLIIVHGKIIKNDIVGYGIKENKILIVPHGSKHKYINYETKKPREIKQNSINKNDKIFLFVGQINPNKGVLELLEIWHADFTNDKHSTLIIAGKINRDLREEIISFNGNGIIIIDRFLEDEELAYLIKLSSLILMPYKNGSVSGVLFTAAAFKKPVLSNNFGSISEYIINEKSCQLFTGYERLFNLQIFFMWL